MLSFFPNAPKLICDMGPGESIAWTCWALIH
uniref:Uncharacterized protein n=1 Tax=Anguilla anguilla TaxID=7936 RepID=A0A0E9V758_ANGAN